MGTLEQRFWSNVVNTLECWEWTGARTTRGYGALSVDGGPKYAHRLSYELNVGEITEGMCVCHHCDNPSCVRPDHLFLGTHKDNMRDCADKGRMSKTGPTCETHGRRKLTAQEVEEIFLSSDTPTELAEAHGVTRENIYYIKKRKTWKQVTDNLER